MGRHVVVGTGAIGAALAARLARAGHEVVAVSRRGGPPIDGVQRVELDAADPGALARVASGASALYNCANPRYSRWERDWPPLSRSLLDAAVASGAVLVTLSNLYGYGPVDHALCEGDPLAATSHKGRVRAQMWRDALAAHERGDARVTELRASDFFGPGATSEAILGERVVPRVLEHRPISLLGDLDAPHSYTFTDDVVSALVIAGGDERAWGRAWHVPTDAPVSARGAVEAIALAAGLAVPRIRSIPWPLVAAAGLVAADLRELREIAYQFDAPFVVDSRAFTDRFGLVPTPRWSAMERTVEWWRRRRGFPLPSLGARCAA